jgi:WD40 repeat protein
VIGRRKLRTIRDDLDHTLAATGVDTTHSLEERLAVREKDGTTRPGEREVGRSLLRLREAVVRTAVIPVLVLFFLVQGSCRKVNPSGTDQTSAPIPLESPKQKPSPTAETNPAAPSPTIPAVRGEEKKSQSPQLKEVASFKAPNENRYLNSLEFSPDGRLLATTSNYGPSVDAKLIDVASGKESYPKATADCDGACAFGPDGRFYAGCSTEGRHEVRVWDFTRNEVVNTFKVPTKVLQINLSPDGKILACLHHVDFRSEIDEDNALSIFDMQTGKIKGAFPSGFTLAFSPDSRLLACATRQNYGIRILDLESCKEKHLLEGHKSNIRSLTFVNSKVLVSNTGTKVLVADKVDKTVRIWNADTGTGITVIDCPQEVDNVLPFPDGRSLVTTYDDKTATFWAVDTGKNEGTMKPKDEERVWHLVFMPDGKTMITAHYNKGIILWEMPARKKLLALKAHDENVMKPTFTRDGKRMALAHSDGLIKIFEVNP